MLDLTGLEDPRFHKEFDSEKEDFEALNTELSKNASEVFKEKSTDYWFKEKDDPEHKETEKHLENGKVQEEQSGY